MAIPEPRLLQLGSHDPSSNPLLNRTTATLLRVVPATDENEPPTYRRCASNVRAYTVPFTFGSNPASAVPSVLFTLARWLRDAPPIEVNDPPRNTVAPSPVTVIACTDPDGEGFGSHAVTLPSVRSTAASPARD